jgi:hypothetical protein
LKNCQPKRSRHSEAGVVVAPPANAHQTTPRPGLRRIFQDRAQPEGVELEGMKFLLRRQHGQPDHAADSTTAVASWAIQPQSASAGTMGGVPGLDRPEFSATQGGDDFAEAIPAVAHGQTVRGRRAGAPNASHARSRPRPAPP